MNRKRGYPIPGEASTGVVFCVGLFFWLTGAMWRTYGARLFLVGCPGLAPWANVWSRAVFVKAAAGRSSLKYALPTVD